MSSPVTCPEAPTCCAASRATPRPARDVKYAFPRLQPRLGNDNGSPRPKDGRDQVAFIDLWRVFTQAAIAPVDSSFHPLI